jgi:hypothetical protein
MSVRSKGHACDNKKTRAGFANALEVSACEPARVLPAAQ